MENNVNEIVETTENVTNETVKKATPASAYCTLLAMTTLTGMGISFGIDVYNWAKSKIRNAKLAKKQKIETVEVDPDETDFTEE